MLVAAAALYPRLVISYAAVQLLNTYLPIIISRFVCVRLLRNVYQNHNLFPLFLTLLLLLLFSCLFSCCWALLSHYFSHYYHVYCYHLFDYLSMCCWCLFIIAQKFTTFWPLCFFFFFALLLILILVVVPWDFLNRFVAFMCYVYLGMVS